MTELKSSIDKRFDDLEKQFDKRLDTVSEELFKIKQCLSAIGKEKQFFDNKEKLSKIEKDIKNINLDVEYLVKKSGVLDMKLSRIKRN
ncbi:hypothetical protein [Psychrobacillus sp. L4]|uniref:hypothetical protein n=1 Tax=Psychrobacillus sp. L4 TaxID=3236892 RepID=UPI0036F3E882